MSVKHPIISVTGSSGAGTTTVRSTFERIFMREKIEAAWIEGDAFHRYDRVDMRRAMEDAAATGNNHFSHFSPEANLLPELENVFAEYGRIGKGQTRHYVHDDAEAKRYGSSPGTFTEWEPFPDRTNVLFYEGLHGAVVTEEVNLARYADLKIGVVPVLQQVAIKQRQRGRLVGRRPHHLLHVHPDNAGAEREMIPGHRQDLGAGRRQSFEQSMNFLAQRGPRLLLGPPAPQQLGEPATEGGTGR